MNHSITYSVETKGLQLPDGTVFGAGREDMLRVVTEESTNGIYRIYDIIGGNAVHKLNTRSWREMRKEVAEFVTYQQSIGNRVFDNNGEIKNFTILTEEYKEG